MKRIRFLTAALVAALVCMSGGGALADGAAKSCLNLEWNFTPPGESSIWIDTRLSAGKDIAARMKTHEGAIERLLAYASAKGVCGLVSDSTSNREFDEWIRDKVVGRLRELHGTKVDPLVAFVRGEAGDVYFAPTQHVIAYSFAALNGDLRFGRLLVAASFAHEWGHARQSAYEVRKALEAEMRKLHGDTVASALDVLAELQADYLAGVFVEHYSQQEQKPVDPKQLEDLWSTLAFRIHPSDHGKADQRSAALRAGRQSVAGRVIDMDKVHRAAFDYVIDVAKREPLE